ncbi:MAG: phage tail tube protein [Oscillospiraceae bacterium]|jgi:hypothetical protein|nr:phage tail tube protein [Oscillospiraceae bacterium]
MARNHMSLREGKVYIDGVEVLNQVSCTINFTPDVAESRVLGEKGKSRRWLGRDITGQMTEYKSTPWLQTAITEYEKSKTTPKFKIVGVQNDETSEYFAKTKKHATVTCIDCVLTGDIPLIALDSGGELVQDSVSFGAYDIV